jgi:hypothetical protein
VEFAQGIVLPGVVSPDVIAEMLGSGTVGIGLRPLVPVSVAPSGIALPITLEPEVEAWTGVVSLPVVVVQPEPDDIMPPPSKAEEVDDMLLVPLDEPVALQVEPGRGPRPPGLISVAPSGMLVPFEPFVPLAPNVPSGEVAPIPEELMVLCALPVAQAQRTARAAIENRRIDISCATLGRRPWCRASSCRRNEPRVGSSCLIAALPLQGLPRSCRHFRYNALQIDAIVRPEAQATPCDKAWHTAGSCNLYVGVVVIWRRKVTGCGLRKTISRLGGRDGGGLAHRLCV